MKKAILILLPLALCACQNKVKEMVRDTRYSAYELVGVQKRDLFKKEVRRVKDDQKETEESYKDALDTLKDIYGLDGGNLEKEYRALNSAYEDAEKRSNEARASIQRLDTTAKDLFAEWKREISEITTPDLRSQSAATLKETQGKYSEFFSALKKAESKMGPVLSRLKDQNLFLKHNLNAKAIAGLKAESIKIQGDIESLIKDMNSSIAHADEFMKSM